VNVVENFFSVVMKVLLTNYAEMSIHEEFFDWHKILERASSHCVVILKHQ
jgi:hypothetical protein